MEKERFIPPENLPVAEGTPNKVEAVSSAEPSEVKSAPEADREAIALEIPTLEKPEDLENLPEPVREKLGLGFNNLGFFVEENKNKFFAGLLQKIGAGMDRQSTAGRFVESLAEGFQRDQENAQKKFEEVAQGEKRRLSNLSYLGGNLLRYGRTVLDFSGYTIASPLRYVTMGAMMFSRGSEAAKEARLKNEEVIEKTRVEDADQAENEALQIYEAAQAKAGEGKEVTKEELNKAYLENIPKDLLQRLNSQPKAEIQTGLARRIVEEVAGDGLKKMLTGLQTELESIDMNDDLTPQQKESEKQKLLKKQERKLKDYDRIVSRYGEIDALATAARWSELTGKGVVKGVTVETLVALPLEKIFDVKIWDHISEMLSTGTAAAAEIAAVDYDKLLGIDPKDGLNIEEAAKIAKHIVENPENASQLEKVYGLAMVEGQQTTLLGFLAEQRGINQLKETLRISDEDAQKVFEQIKAGRLSGKDFGMFLKGLKAGQISPQELDEILDKAKKDYFIQNPGKMENYIFGTRYENVIEGSGDSVWKSTKEIFLKHHDYDKFGYEGDATDQTALDKWAETKTANLLKAYAQEHNGKMPELVHEGDRVIMEIGEDGEPHLKIINPDYQDIEPQPLPERDVKVEPETPVAEAPPKVVMPTEAEVETPTAASLPETSGDRLTGLDIPELSQEHKNLLPPLGYSENYIKDLKEIMKSGDVENRENVFKDIDKKLGTILNQIKPGIENTILQKQHEALGLLKSHLSRIMYEIMHEAQGAIKAEEETKNIFSNFKELYDSATTEDHPTLLKQYLLSVTEEKEYTGTKLSDQKLNVFARMYSTKKAMDKLKFDTSKAIQDIFESFERDLKSSTKALLEGHLANLNSSDAPVLIENIEGDVFFAKPLGQDKWELFNSQNDQQFERRFMRWGHKKDFTVKDIKKFLGWTEHSK